MDTTQELLEKTKAEIADLESAGVVMSGNAFSQILLLKGEPEGADSLLAGADGKALRAALTALGYEPQDWVALSTLDKEGFSLVPGTLRLAVATLDPATIIVLDEPARATLCEAFVEELVDVERIEEAMLQPGYIAHILGMRVMALGGFEESLTDPQKKQLMWAYLKQLPPLGEPY